MRPLKTAFLVIFLWVFSSNTSSAQLGQGSVILTPQVTQSAFTNTYGFEIQILVDDVLALNYSYHMGPEGYHIPLPVFAGVMVGAFTGVGYGIALIPEGITLHLPLFDDKLFFSPYVNPLGLDIIYSDYEWGKWGMFDSEATENTHVTMNFGAKLTWDTGTGMIIAPFYRYTTAWNFKKYSKSEFGVGIGFAAY
jgi:hypothetical protein